MASSTVSSHTEPCNPISISDAARDYLAELLARQEVTGIGVRVFVTQPGTPRAETCLAYCRPNEEEAGDLTFDLGPFPLYIEAGSVSFLEGAEVDFSADRMGGQLTIKAPNAKMPKVNDDSPLADRVTYTLYAEINPGLASHGGEIRLVDITPDNVAILQFGGGCQGCSAVDLTLKSVVERTLMERIPELKGVRDVTDHSDTTNAYYA